MPGLTEQESESRKGGSREMDKKDNGEGQMDDWGGLGSSGDNQRDHEDTINTR